MRSPSNTTVISNFHLIVCLWYDECVMLAVGSARRWEEQEIWEKMSTVF
jgi:hypothetical protein